VTDAIASGIRTLIVDDEPPGRSKLRRLVMAEPDGVVVGEASNGIEAVDAIRTLAPDLVFLDVQMPELDGFGVIEQIGVDAMPPVVFVTAYDDHAVRAFEVRALDYLLKPYQPERFRSVFSRARDRQRARLERAEPNGGETVATRLGELLALLGGVPAATTAFLQRILVQTGDRAIFIPVDRIDRVESDRNYVTLYTASGTFQLRATITALAGRLDPARFLRANRSTLVRLDAIKEMYQWSHGDWRIVTHDGTIVPWSRRFRAGADEVFGA
jgi:two-component system, LytTR family, response regulator